MSVPFIDISRTEPGFAETWVATVANMSAKAQFVGGSVVSQFETRLADRAGVRFAVGCANGTDAIQLALRALGVGLGDKVIVPDMTFWATFEAVVNVNARPVTVDVSLEDGGVDLVAFEEAVRTVRPKAAVVAHLYGWGTARLTELRDLCRRHSVHLVEDGAQCFGVEWQGGSIYAGAEIATTSFYPAKVLGAAGDAGAVFTGDQALAERVRMLANHGRTAHYGYGDVGWNSRLDSLQAAYINLCLDHLDERIASRRESAQKYRERLPAVGLTPMSPPKGYLENGYCNVLLIADAKKKARLEETLKARSIGFGNIYPGPMSDQPGAANFLDRHVGGRNAAALCAQVINLPLFAYMTDAELDEVIDAVAAAG